MITKRLSLVAIAAAFAVSSSLAMLQSSRPALADADDHHPRHVQPHPGYHWVNGQWVPNNVVNNGGHWVNGQWVPNNGNWNGNGNNGRHRKHKKHHDKDHDGDRH